MCSYTYAMNGMHGGEERGKMSKIKCIKTWTRTYKNNVRVTFSLFFLPLRNKINIAAQEFLLIIVLLAEKLFKDFPIENFYDFRELKNEILPLTILIADVCCRNLLLPYDFLYFRILLFSIIFYECAEKDFI